MDVSKMSLTELKALAYDMIAQKEQLQGQLNQVNQMIGNKMREEENVRTDNTELVDRNKEPEEGKSNT